MVNPIRKAVSRAKRVARRIAGRESVNVAGQFWDQQIAESGVIYWTAHNVVREYVNECTTGVSWVWPLHAFKIGWAYKPLPSGLSIGCGTGALERSVRWLRICDEMLGIDVSAESIKEAKRLAKEEKQTGIRYRLVDAEGYDLPEEAYDVVFFHGSLHHISDPDTLLKQVARALKPHGFLYVDDYVGPNRDQWNESHLALARVESEKVDPKLYLNPLNPPLDYRDPSEMIRSDRIRPAIEENFSVLHYKPYWGNILFPLLCHIDGYALQRPENAHLLQRWIDREKELVADGTLVDPLFAVYVARRKDWRG